jgi:hypothetical protein
MLVLVGEVTPPVPATAFGQVGHDEQQRHRRAPQIRRYLRAVLKDAACTRQLLVDDPGLEPAPRR